MNVGALRWFHDIHGATPLRDLGWAYVLLGGLLLLLCVCMYALITTFRDGGRK